MDEFIQCQMSVARFEVLLAFGVAFAVGFWIAT